MRDAAAASQVALALFGRTRQGVLGLLFGEPHREFYQQEIARAAGTRLSAVQRDLRTLVATGLVARRRRGNRVYYQANAVSPIFAELQGIVLKTVGLAGILRSVLEPLAKQIQVAFVFGSLAAGTARADSDVDLLVIGDAGLRALAPLLAPARMALGREINPVTVTPSEWARKVRAGDHFLTSVQEGPRIFVFGDEDELGRLGQHGTLAQA